MWSLFSKTTNYLSVKTTLNINVLRNLAAFTVRDVLYETSDEAGTLLTRFAKHLALENRKSTPLVPTTIRYADYFPISDERYFLNELKRTPSDQLPALIIYAFTYRSNAQPPKFVTALNEINNELVQRLNDMDNETIYNTLYSLLFLMPNWITRTEFYKDAVQCLAEDVLKAAPSKEKFVQLCFYLGLAKKHAAVEKNGQLLQKLLEKYLNDLLPELTPMDLALICNAVFKTASSVKNTKQFAKLITEEVLRLDMSVKGNDALLVTFVKALRFMRVHSKELCEHLSKLSTETFVQNLELRGAAHLLAYFAENLWDDNACIDVYHKQILEHLRTCGHANAISNTLRGKDINSYLLSLSQLNYASVSDKELKFIERLVWELHERNHFKYYPDQLVEICQSLWLLNHKSTDLLQEALYLKKNAKAFDKQQRELPKVDNRLTVLQVAAAIETPEIKLKIPNFVPYDFNAAAPAYLLKDRDDISKYANQLESDASIAEVNIVSPIKGINIPGLLVHLKTPANTQAFVEILTNEQVLRFSKEPPAIMRLKIRLLRALGQQVIVLYPEQLLKDGTQLVELINAQIAGDSKKDEADATDNEVDEQIPKQQTVQQSI